MIEDEGFRSLFRQESAEYLQQLDDGFQRPVEFFAYPNGDYDTRTEACVRRHYRGAVTASRSTRHVARSVAAVRSVSVVDAADPLTSG